MLKIKSEFYPNQFIVISTQEEHDKLDDMRLFILKDFLLFVHTERSEYEYSKEYLHKTFSMFPDGWSYYHTKHFQKYSIINSVVTIPGNIYFNLTRQPDFQVVQKI